MSDDKWHPGKLFPRLDSKKQQEPSSPGGAGTSPVKSLSGKDVWYPGYVKDKVVTKFHKEVGNLKNHVKQKRELRRRTNNNEVIGKLSVKLTSGRCMSVPRPYVEVHFEGHEQRSDAVSTQSNKDIEFRNASFEFDVTDPTADILIFLFDDSNVKQDYCVGRVVVPLSTCLAYDQPKAKSATWYEVYPGYLASEDGGVLREKFEEAVAGMPGSGMLKPKKPIAYLQIESELTLTSSVVQAYLRNAPFYDAVDDELESDADNKEGDKFDPRILKRNVSRLKYAVGAPPLLAWVCGFPQCGLLLPLHFYLCFAAGLWQLPLFFFGFVSVNSFLSYQGLKFDHLVIWEQDVGPEELKGISKKFGMLMQTMGGIMKLTSIIANFFEQFANVWNFADVRVTTLALGGLGAFCLVLSLILALFPLRFIVFILGCGVIAGITMQGLKPANAGDSKAAPEIPPPVSNFFKRVPNNLEMAHRYIAMLQQQSGEKNNMKTSKKS